ncbi:MAG: sterol desaturase family protein [Verrucomicrobiales bacterium]|nr:sterol desaturase family protein [Verrucomicrobiales bacterium]
MNDSRSAFVAGPLQKLKGNYGLYFNIWDRIMGTNLPDYETRFREVMSRPAPKSNRPATTSAGAVNAAATQTTASEA